MVVALLSHDDACRVLFTPTTDDDDDDDESASPTYVIHDIHNMNTRYINDDPFEFGILADILDRYATDAMKTHVVDAGRAYVKDNRLISID